MMDIMLGIEERVILERGSQKVFQFLFRIGKNMMVCALRKFEVAERLNPTGFFHWAITSYRQEKLKETASSFPIQMPASR